MALLFFLLAYWWKQGQTSPGEDVEGPEITLPPDPPLQPVNKPGPNHSMVGLTTNIGVDDPAALRDLIVTVLKALGMTEQGAKDLIQGKVIYGHDAHVYEDICSLIFIQCLECQSMVAIEHAELFHAVCYFPESDLIVAYCEECESFTEVKVSTFYNSAVVHVPKARAH